MALLDHNGSGAVQHKSQLQSGLQFQKILRVPGKAAQRAEVGEVGDGIELLRRSTKLFKSDIRAIAAGRLALSTAP